MTEKQNKAFLKAEGWLCRSVVMNLWKDPNSGISYYGYRALEIASRRKRQREYRRLKAAGWEYHVLGDGFGNIYTRWCWSEKRDNGKCLFADTRQEALQTLEAQP